MKIADEQKISDIHMAFSDSRGNYASYCPSEVARKLFPKSEWRNHMDAVRLVADKLVFDGVIVVMQKGVIINEKASCAKGPIRLKRR